MLRLWPEKIRIGLFPGHCTLQRGRATERMEFAPGAGLPNLLHALGELLERAKPFGRFASVEVFVSDGFGRFTLVPWQRKLDSHDQIQAYGRACLEASYGLGGEDWVLHAGFRHHGAAGMAAALPASLVETVSELLAQHGMRLRAMMPVVAAAYWYHKSKRKAGASLLWLEEQGRLTAFAYRAGRLQSIDVEPVLGREGAAIRLSNRVQLANEGLSHVDAWSSLRMPCDAEELSSMFSGTAINQLKRARWGVL